MSELESTGKFDKMSIETDEDEHSLEMHLPYLYKVLSRSFPDGPASFPPLIPILVGATVPNVERSFGSIFAPYLRDPSSVFIISSDFCHWGLRFRYTYYLPNAPTGASTSSAASLPDPNSGHSLNSSSRAPTSPAIHESIAAMDKMAMNAIEGGKHKDFLKNLNDTGNTVCGRHPIGVMMATIERVEQEDGWDAENDGKKGRFQFVRYERSSDVVKIGDSSVSYASAFVVL
ncbi:MAG: hypothetical protein M4579_006800 [Chaenotheca gracillima]|nr:MAG: hypothetical protein M4579_006800 [Chaenotheca gracillima]